MNEIENSISRYEIVLLEDDPTTLKLLDEMLTKRNIVVNAFIKGEEALRKILDDPNIGAFLVDIEIRSPYPGGPRTGLQGYDVANRILSQAPNRLLSVVVMTGLEQEEALDSVNIFQVRSIYFSKMKWINAANETKKDETFDELALVLKRAIEATPYKWLAEVRQEYPKSRWVYEKKEGTKTLPPYWYIYRNLWLSHNWKYIEPQISKRATQIVNSYINGEARKLRGEHLSLKESPNEIAFQEQLVGRRVIYALKALQPAYWENLIRGEQVEEEKPVLDGEIWQSITSDDVRTQVKKLNSFAAKHNLVNLHAKLQETMTKIDQLESKSAEKLTRHQNEELHKLIIRQQKFVKPLTEPKKQMRETVTELANALDVENEDIRKAFVPYLRFWNLKFTKVEWAKKPTQTGGGRDPLTQTLLLLGIRKEDIQGKDLQNWKLLLPEERKWLQNFTED